MKLITVATWVPIGIMLAATVISGVSSRWDVAFHRHHKPRRPARRG